MNNRQINPINPDDPKWTAYVLGELDETERAEIERLIETSDEARALVDELNLATVMLKEELTPLSALAMTPKQKAAIRAAAEPARARLALFPMKWGWATAGMAAAFVLAVTPLLVTKEAPQAPEPTETRIAQVIEEREQLRDARQQQQPGQEANESKQKAEAYAEKAEKQDQSLEPESRLRARSESDDRKDADAAKKLATPDAAAPPPPPPAPAPPPPELRQYVEAGNATAAGVVGGVIGGQLDNPALVEAAKNALRKEAAAAPQAAPAPAAPVIAGAGAVAGARGGGGGGGRGAGAGPQQGQGVGQGQGQGGAVGGQDQVGNQGRFFRDGLAVTQTFAAPPPPPPPPSVIFGGNIDNLRRLAANTEAYDRIADNPFIRTTQEPLATFSIDVDTASYANMRRFLTQNQMPPRDSVRIEELINYFNYDYAQPQGNDPIAPNMEVAAAPWNPQSRLLRIGIKAREVNANRRPPSNLVFLIDVSGSMNSPVKLPLAKAGLKMMVDRLGENDTVSIVVYAGASGLVLPPTSAVRKERIQQAIDSLQPGGSTNGASGIQLAYNQAVINFIKGGTNRVILMTDGDFNVGITNQGDLTRLIEARAKSGVFLSVLGFGMGNIKDSTLEKLADQGNGHYAYIDNINEARKVLVEEMGSTLVTVAKDVKIQVDFNPARVEAYRLIGYENRVLRTEDFNNDLKDAGDMGAGHTVTALFEVVPKGGNVPGPSIDPSKYTTAPASADQARIPASTSNEMLTLRVRYKQPDSDTSTKKEYPLVDRGGAFARATVDFRFAAAVAEFGMILRESPYRGNASLDAVLDLAEGSRGQDRSGYRQEFIELVQRAKRLR